MTSARSPVTGPPRVGLAGAVGIGVGSMLGAGVFVVWGPAAAAAGRWLLAAVVLAAIVAAINAFSTAQLATVHPVSGGAYIYGSREVGPAWGFIAGLAFVIGKIASVAAMGLAIGAYLWPGHPAVAASVAIGLTWALNARGVTRTAWATTAIAAIVLVGLGVITAVSLWSPAAPHASGAAAPHTTPLGVASAAALIFFAFAGYARLATLGEEVRDPQRTIPRAVAIAVIVVVGVYLALAAVLLRNPGPVDLAGSDAPLAFALPEGPAWRSLLAVLATLATGGALVALMAGIGRTSMAMAREGDFPAWLAAKSAHGVPVLAEAAAGAASIAVVWFADVGFALAMSSACVLTYYAVANAAAFRARGRMKSFTVPRVVSAAGMALCVGLALSLERAPTLVAVGIGVCGWLGWKIASRWNGGARAAVDPDIDPLKEMS